MASASVCRLQSRAPGVARRARPRHRDMPGDHHWLWQCRDPRTHLDTGRGAHFHPGVADGHRGSGRHTRRYLLPVPVPRTRRIRPVQLDGRRLSEHRPVARRTARRHHPRGLGRPRRAGGRGVCVHLRRPSREPADQGLRRVGEPGRDRRTRYSFRSVYNSFCSENVKCIHIPMYFHKCASLYLASIVMYLIML